MTTPTDAFRETLLQFSEALEPIHECMDGQRADMLRRGYSETAAEEVAIRVFNHLLGLAQPT